VAKLPPTVSYTAKVGTFGGANTDTGAAGVSTTSVGVFGQAGNAKGLPAGWTCGVLGASAGKPGVVGWSSTSHGVEGWSTKSDGVRGASEYGTGVNGISIAGTGVYGTTAGVAAAMFVKGRRGGVVGCSRDADGVIGISQTQIGVTAISGGHAFIAETLGGPGNYAGYFVGNVHMTGMLTSDSVKGAVVPFPDGTKRLLVCMESPEPWFEDFGAGRLKGGRAVVKLDADFAKVIKRGDYHVFFTPKGDCRGLYVRRQGGASFEVCELQGGRSSVAFSYRIVGKRKDIKAHKRFAKIDKPPTPPARRTGRTQPPQGTLLVNLHKQAGVKPARARRRKIAHSP
jgi:hypothetical protein